MHEEINGLIIYVPEHFSCFEVFPPELIAIYGKEDLKRIWFFMNPLVLITIDRLRGRYGPALMNTYNFKDEILLKYGVHHYRGWRSKDCHVGAKYSQHKMGNAADIVFVNVNAETVRADILNRPYDRVFENITCIEMGVSWLHFDVRPHDKANKGILKIYP
jgi:hypothetical protein